MFSILYLITSGALIGSNVLIFRKAAILPNNGVDGYICLYYIFSSIIFSILKYLFEGYSLLFHLSEIFYGAIMGLIIFSASKTYSKALSEGGAGITSATFSSAAFVTPIITYLIFGEKYITLETYKILSMLIALFAIFYPATLSKKNLKKFNMSKKWFISIITSCALHVLYMVFIKWKSLTSLHFKEHYIFFAKISPRSLWIDSIGLLVTGILAFLSLYTNTDNTKKLNLKHAYLAFPSSIILSVSHFLVVEGFRYSTPNTAAFLWPIYAVSSIITSSFVGKIAFKEKLPYSQIFLMSAAALPALITLF